MGALRGFAARGSWLAAAFAAERRAPPGRAGPAPGRPIQSRDEVAADLRRRAARLPGPAAVDAAAAAAGGGDTGPGARVRPASAAARLAADRRGHDAYADAVRREALRRFRPCARGLRPAAGPEAADPLHWAGPAQLGPPAWGMRG